MLSLGYTDPLTEELKQSLLLNPKNIEKALPGLCPYVPVAAAPALDSLRDIR